MTAPRARLTTLLLTALLGAMGGPAFAKEQERAAPAGERRCPADAPFSIGGEAFGPGDVARVEAQFDALGMPVILIELTDQSRSRFVALQEGRVGKTLPICLGETLLSDPYLTEPITGSSLQIAGAMTAAETRELARRIREQLGLAPPGRGARDDAKEKV
jgi:hypothetical protein